MLAMSSPVDQDCGAPDAFSRWGDKREIRFEKAAEAVPGRPG